MSRNNSRPNDDPFEFGKEEVKSIKLFVDLTATANLLTDRQKIELHLRSIKSLLDVVQAEYNIPHIDDIIERSERRRRYEESTCSDYNNILSTTFEGEDTMEENDQFANQ